MGSIYRAVDENLGVEVAVKENLFTTEEYARQFRLEAVILANLRHPNLPRVSDHFVIAGEGQYLIMDYIEGEDLRQRMERVGLLPEDEVIQVGAAMCDALEYLHSRKPPVLHRDIKPGNVKVSPDGHIYLVDFGLAKIIQGNQATTTGARAMTPGYSPPEQYGTARTDARTDIYSLGATLYAALTGVIPEDGLARAMDNAELTPLRKRNPEVARRLAAAIEKAMEVDPGDRFQTADAFKLALLNAKSKTQQLTGTYTISPPPPDAERPADSPLKAAVLTHSIPLEEQAFVSPRKKQMQRTTRMIRTIGGGALAFLVTAFLFILFLAPQLLPASARSYFPFLPTIPEALSTSTNLPTETDVPLVQETPTLPESPTLEATAIAEVIVDATQTAASALTQTLAPTPIGADYLQIAYASTRTGVSQIYLTNLLTDEALPITNMPGGACQPSWAPDGSKLVFTSPCGIKKDNYSESSLFIIDADGSNLIPLSTASIPGGDFEPAWSPDGKYIAFTSLRDGYMQIYSYNLASSSITRLVETPLNKPARQASWSPDGKTIIFAYQRVDSYELWTMSAFGLDEKAFLQSGDLLSNNSPIFSPDGKYILFSQANTKDAKLPDLYFVKLSDPSAPLKVSLGVNSISDVHYSPDGNWLAYEAGGERGYHVYYSTPSGGNQARITQDVFSDDFDPAWRPILK
ncbi:MAG: PD40 domain-containing protein [Anaerolineales bacterium]|nr:PD40 domain-containing protein [Anaerolineales bacterium]